MWIRQEANVEYQVGIVGNAIFEAEADARHQNGIVAGSFLEFLNDVRPQFMNIEL